MGDVAAFFDMDGYAAYVWPAFGVSAAVLIGLLVASVRALRANEAALRALETETPARRETA